MPHWPQPPQWADRVVHVEPGDLAACLANLGRPRLGRDGSTRILTAEAAVAEWTRDGTAEVDAYVLPSPSGHHSAGIRYGAGGGDYLSPQFDRERLASLLEERAAEPSAGPRP